MYGNAQMAFFKTLAAKLCMQSALEVLTAASTYGVKQQSIVLEPTDHINILVATWSYHLTFKESYITIM
jgi:TorA maturation chaperone TorD